VEIARGDGTRGDSAWDREKKERACHSRDVFSYLTKN